MRTKNIRGQVKQKIKEYFFRNPTVKLRVREIGRRLEVPLPSVIRYTKELIKEKILKIEEVSNIKLFVADTNSEMFIFEKKLNNLKQISNSGLKEYLIEKYSNPAIVLFGSFSKGEDIESSDIDIYIQTPSKKEHSLEKFEKKLNKTIQTFIHKDIREISNPMLSNNIINGIVINGFIEVFKWKVGMNA